MNSGSERRSPTAVSSPAKFGRGIRISNENESGLAVLQLRCMIVDRHHLNAAEFCTQRVCPANQELLRHVNIDIAKLIGVVKQ